MRLSRHRGTPTFFHSSSQWVVLAALGLAPVACTTNNYYEVVDSDGGVTSDEDPDTSAGESSEPADPDTESSDPTATEPEETATDSDGTSNDTTTSGETDVLDGGAGDAGPTPVSEGAPIPDTLAADLQIDVFGTVGNRYWFVVSDDQLEQMNQRYGGGGPIFINQFGDIYTPGGGAEEVTYVDHLLATTKGDPSQTADFGKVQVKLVGESTGRPWDDSSLPNLKIDSDEFTPGNRIGGVKHMRFNNAIVGSIFREKLTLDLYNQLGYPAPRATYAWVSTSVWGPDVAVPYILVESYKPQFCKFREAELGGGCENMWEFPGGFGYGAFDPPETCQFDECDNTRVNEFNDLVIATPPGEGFKAALADWFDWDRFHQFQCLSWILGTGDDALHNSNNFVLAERSDGKFQMFPYSVDISLGQDWYQKVILPGQGLMASGCQDDPACWADTISTCEGLVADFAAADPVQKLDDLYATLETEGMLRAGDEGRYESLRSHIERRLVELPEELELNREAPYWDFDIYCEPPQIACGDFCAYPQDCFLCDDPGIPVEPEPRPLPIAQELFLDGGVGDAGVVPPEQDSGIIVEPPPDQCLPVIEVYEPGLEPGIK